MDDLSTHVASADPTFDPCQSLMWIECSPEKKEAGLVDSALGMTEKKITKLESAQHVAAWESDTLKLAKDATVCAKLLKQAVNNERTDRLARITHIKEQNKIGAGIVTSFAAKNCHHVTLACPDAEGQLSEDTGCPTPFSFLTHGMFKMVYESRVNCFDIARRYVRMFLTPCSFSLTSFLTMALCLYGLT